MFSLCKSAGDFRYSNINISSNILCTYICVWHHTLFHMLQEKLCPIDHEAKFFCTVNIIKKTKAAQGHGPYFHGQMCFHGHMVFPRPKGVSTAMLPNDLWTCEPWSNGPPGLGPYHRRQHQTEWHQMVHAYWVHGHGPEPAAFARAREHPLVLPSPRSSQSSFSPQEPLLHHRSPRSWRMDATMVSHLLVSSTSILAARVSSERHCRDSRLHFR